MQRRSWIRTFAVVALLVAAACGDDEPSGDGSGKARSTTSTEPASAALVDAACNGAAEVEPAAPRKITGSEVTEASGIAIVPGSDGPVWVHNDSGDRARVFAIDDTGKVTSHDVPGAQAVDWEDMAAGPDGRLYIGDIGDNGSARPSVTVYAFAPPDPAADGPATEIATMTLTYEDGPHNAEAMMIDPVDELLMVVTKADGPAGIYTAPLDSTAGGVLTRVGEVDTGGLPLLGQVTGGDVSPDGSAVLLRTYGKALLYERPSGTPIHEAFTSPACDVPAGAEAQGEAIAFNGTGDGYLTIGEGGDPTISTFAPAT